MATIIAGTFPVNGVSPIETGELKIEIEDETWLKTGVLDTDAASYPGVPTVPVAVAIGEGNIVTEDIQKVVNGMCWDGTHFWAITDGSSSINYIYQYTSEFVYTGYSILVNSLDVEGICWNGSHLCVISSDNDEILEIDRTTGSVFRITEIVTNLVSSLTDICWDGTSFYITDTRYDRVYKFSTSGVQEAAFTGDFGNPGGICYNDGYLYIVASTGVYQHTIAGEFVEFFTFLESTSASGICWDGPSYYITNSSNGTATPYAAILAVGINEKMVDTSTSLPIYTRIK